MSLSKNEVQFIESLINTFISSKRNTQKEFYLHALCKLPQKLDIPNTIISIFQKCKGQAQEKVIVLYCVYILANKELINFIKPSDLFDHFKIIMTETSSEIEFSNCLLIHETLKLIISGLTTFSPFSIYSSIISWSTPLAPVALSALALNHAEFLGNAVTYFVNHEINNNMSISALTSFFGTHLYGELPADLTSLMQNDFFQKIYDIIHQNIKGNPTVYVPLLGSLFSFMETKESCSICFDFKEELKELLASSYISIRIIVAETLCKLPVSCDDEKFNTNLQLVEFLPHFIQSISDFHGAMADKLVEFVEPRSMDPNFQSLVLSLFGNGKSLCVLFFICCKLNLFEKSEEIVDAAFPSDVTKEYAHAICFATTEMADKFKSNEKIIRETTRFLIYSLQNYYEDFGIYASSGFLAFSRACVEKPEVYLRAALEQLQFLTNEASLSNAIGAIASYLFDTGPIIPPKVSNDVYSNTAVNCLIKIVTAKGDSRDRLIFPLQLLSASLEGKKICSDDLTKYHDKPLVDICDDLIPESVIDDVHTKILDLIQKEPSANIVAICLNSSISNPVAVADNAQSIDPFNQDLFVSFYANAAKRNVTQAIDRFTRILREAYTPTSTRSLISRVLFSSPQKSSVPTAAVFIAGTQIIKNGGNLKETHIQALFNIFDSSYTETTESEEFLRELCKTRKKVNVPLQLIPKILKSQFFVHCIPDFLCMIEKSNDYILLALTNWFSVMKKTPALINENQQFVDSCLKDNEQFFHTLVEYALNQASVVGSLNFMESVSRYSPDTFSLAPSVFGWLGPICLSQNEDERILAVSALSKLFHVEANLPFSSVPIGQILQNTLAFYKLIVDKISLELSASISDVLAPSLSLTSALFIYAAVQQKGLDFVKKSSNLFETILKLGVSETVSISFYGRKILQHISSLDKQFCLASLFPMKNNNCSYDFAEYNADYEFVKTFALLFKKFKIENDQSVKTCAFRFLFAFTESIRTHETDYILIWLAIYVSTSLVLGYEQMSNAEFRLSVKAASELTTRCFSRIGIIIRNLVDADFDSNRSISDVFSSFICKFNQQQLEEFLVPLQTVFNLKKSDSLSLTIVSAHILTSVYKYISSFSESKDLVKLYEKEISKLSVVGKDECCRNISAHFADVFSSSDIEKMDDETTFNIQTCVLRSLINPDDDLRVDCIKFFCTILSVESKENIRKDLKRIFDNLTSSFELSQEVGLDLLLDGVAAVVAVDPSIRPFVSMSQLSLPRLLILSVNESQSIREKAKKIMRILTSVKTDDEVIPALIKIIGADEVDVIARFFVSWAEKNQITETVISTIRAFSNVLTDNHRTMFIAKVTPILVPIIDEVDHPLQKQAIEIFSTLLGV